MTQNQPFYFMAGTTGLPIWHRCQEQPNGSYIMTGCDPKHTIKIGSIINGAGLVEEATDDGPKVFLSKVGWEVTEEIERRDHKGSFTNPEDAKNSFFKVRIEVAKRVLRHSTLTT